MNYLPHCNATYISPFNLLKTCESSDWRMRHMPVVLTWRFVNRRE